jgi:TRAP-type C4-dicarboxylate transport system substrate-binding protein
MVTSLLGGCAVSKRLFAVLLLSFVSGAWAGPARATTTIKIATLAPRGSWSNVFLKWGQEVSDQTKGEVQFDIQWNGTAGDEALMVQKIRTGQIDGAAVTLLGLAQTGVTDVLLFGLPGLFTSWQKLDAAREAVKDDLERQFEQKGFTVVGWGDVGALKEMSVGFEIHHPSDLRGKGVFYYAGDPITPKVYAAIGGINPKQLNITEVLQNLTSGAVNVLMAPPFAAEQLQWASRVDHISTQTLAYAIGALIMSTSRLNSLPPGVKDAILAKGKETTAELNRKVRDLDAQAFARLKATKTAYEPTPSDVAEWAPIFVQVSKQLRGTVFTPALFDKVVAIADNPLAK